MTKEQQIIVKMPEDASRTVLEKRIEEFVDLDDVSNMHYVEIFLNATQRPYFKEKGPDYWLNSHSIYVGALASRLGEEVQKAHPEYFNKHIDIRIDTLFIMGLLHDIGKYWLKDPSLLDKTDTLTDKDIRTLRLHPEIGMVILDTDYLIFGHRDAGDVINSVIAHHEIAKKGNGYPYGEDPHELPEYMHIISLADYHITKIDARPYTIPITEAEAKRWAIEQRFGNVIPKPIFKTWLDTDFNILDDFSHKQEFLAHPVKNSQTLYLTTEKY